MRVQEIIDAMGGRAYVMGLCGIKTAQVSHFYNVPYIPVHHLKLFIALRPELDWPYLLNSDTTSVEFVLSLKGLRDLRYARLRKRKKESIN